jgi:ribosomal protein S27AE
VAVERVAAQLQRAEQRAPGETIDLVSMNSVDAGEIFRKQSHCPNCGVEVAAEAKFCPECGTRM